MLIFFLELDFLEIESPIDLSSKGLSLFISYRDYNN